MAKRKETKIPKTLIYVIIGVIIILAIMGTYGWAFDAVGG